MAPVKPNGPHTLANFASCSSLLRYLKREAAAVVQPYGLPWSGGALGGVVARAAAGSSGGDAAGGAPESAPASAGGGSFSSTNIQEAGVDEPDVVKSDGRRLFTLIEQRRLVIADLTASTPKVVGSMDLPQEDGSSELLLAGDRVLLLGHSYPTDQSDGRPYQPTSTVRVVDVSDPARLQTAAMLRIEGQYASARLVSGVVRLVVGHAPQGPALTLPGAYEPGMEEALVEKHKAAIRASKIDDWLPTYSLERPGAKAVTAPVVPCASVLRPQQFSGLGSVSVLTIDPADPKPNDVACVLGGGRLVYASPHNVFVATERWDASTAGVGGPAVRRQMPPTRTQVHQFAIPGRAPAAYVASGEVVGTLVNQFSMSEHEGKLRLAATHRDFSSTAPNADNTDNIVYVLEAKDGQLAQVGKLAGLGHDGESIQSVRFIGTRGYVVTFRQTDPLYVLDLRDPAKPKKLGELQVPGFSSYLHPVDDTTLLGVGTGPDESSPNTGMAGLQVSLFNVADPAKPVRLANRVFSTASSIAQHDHHAFLWWAPAGKLVLPIDQFNADDGYRAVHGALVLPVDPQKGFGEPAIVKHAAQVYRAMVSDGRLLTLTAQELVSTDLTTLAPRSRTAW